MSEQLQISTGYAEVNGAKLYYEIAGEGHPFVLIHGGLVDRRLWDDQFSTFARQYRVIRYDVRGFGNSTPVTAHTAAYSFTDDLDVLLHVLGIEKPYLMGLSMGGGIAIDYTVAHPDNVAALIAVGSGISGYTFRSEDKEKWDEIEAALARGDIEHVVELENRIWTDGPNRTPDQVNPTVRARVHEMNKQNYAVSAQDGTEPTPPTKLATDNLENIHVPLLIIVGDQDVPDILEIADILEDKVAGAKKVVIPNTAHHLNMEQPETFNRIVLDFLSTL